MLKPSKEKDNDWIRTGKQLTEAEEKQQKFNWEVVVNFLKLKGAKNIIFFKDADKALEKWVTGVGELEINEDGSAVIILDSGKKLSEKIIDELALHIKLLSGKWLIYVEKKDVDNTWLKIKKLHKSRKIWSAKVSTCSSTERSHVICVYTKNYLDVKDVMKVREELRSAGIKNKISYKPDIYTMLGIYANTKDKFGISKVCRYTA